MSKTDNTGEDVADKEDESMAELQQTMQVLLEGMTSIQQQLSAQGQELQEPQPTRIGDPSTNMGRFV